MKLFEINPALRLGDVPLFKAVAILSFGFAIISALIIFFHSDIRFDFSYEGFNTAFFVIFKVPVAILAAGISILGVISLIHRASQTSLQIKQTTEQNTFANFYKHRQEYIDHLSQLKEEMPDHIKSGINEKIIRGFYTSTYPFNSALNFSITPKLGWIESFDTGLIELCFLLQKIKSNENCKSSILLYREFLRLETSIRQDLLRIHSGDNARYLSPADKTILIKYHTGSTENIAMPGLVISALFSRICDYADLLTKLKYLADEFEGTMLYGTDAYSSFSMSKHNKTLDNEQAWLERLRSGEVCELNQNDHDKFIKLCEEIKIMYDRKIKELEDRKNSRTGSHEKE